jgi:hypothetical protein
MMMMKNTQKAEENLNLAKIVILSLMMPYQILKILFKIANLIKNGVLIKVGFVICKHPVLKKKRQNNWPSGWIFGKFYGIVKDEKDST